MAPQLVDQKKEQVQLYGLAALFTGGRLFVGAISVLYVLSHGITVAEFAGIKSLQVATFLIFDIPAGLYTKFLGYRVSLISMFILSILGLFLYILGNSLSHFMLAEFITAISLCLYTPAYTDYVMDFLKRNPDALIEQVFHRSGMYSGIATVLCGSLGGYLFTIGRTQPYFAGIIVQVFGLFLVCKVKESFKRNENKVIENSGFFKEVSSVFRSLNIALLTPFLFLFTIQLTAQPLYHYWQPLFYEIDSKISGDLLGAVFLSYSLCSIFLNYAFSNLSKRPFFRSSNCIFFMLALSALLYLLTSISHDMLVVFVTFSILQGVLFTSQTCISARMNRFIEDENRPVTLKLISFFSRIGMLISFVIVQILPSMKVHQLYFLSAILLGFSVVLIKSIDYKFLSKFFNTEVEFEKVV